MNMGRAHRTRRRMGPGPSPALTISSSTIHCNPLPCPSLSEAKTLASLIPHWSSHRTNNSAKGKARWAAEMVVRIRLARFGCWNRPFYRLMAADSSCPRDGRHLEVLGYYNPIPGKDGGKRMGLKFDRVKYWLSVGAQPSDPAERMLFHAGILPPPPVPVLAMARKGGPRDRRPIDPMTRCPLDIEGLTIVDDPNTSHSENGAPIEEMA